jgi:hypothetical protein
MSKAQITGILMTAFIAVAAVALTKRFIPQVPV